MNKLFKNIRLLRKVLPAAVYDFQLRLRRISQNGSRRTASTPSSHFAHAPRLAQKSCISPRKDFPKKPNAILLALAILFCFLSLPVASAEQLVVPGTKSQISLKMEPAHPKPFQVVHFITESFSTDLNRSEIEWYLNGKLIKSGMGLKEFDTTVGNFGTKQEVRMVAKTSIGTLQSTAVLLPAQVDIFWQAHSFTPPFYKGKALPTHKSGITVVAAPHLVTTSGVALDPADLIYSWKENGVAKADKSGVGKSSYNVREISIMRGNVFIEVSVTAPTGPLQAVEKMMIYPEETPKVFLYENDPLEGIRYNRALSENFRLVNDEVTIEAIPYFFGTQNKESYDIVYGWSLNGTPITNNDTAQGAVTLRQTGESGFASLNVHVRHRKNLLEAVTTKLSLEFGKPSPKPFSPTP